MWDNPGYSSSRCFTLLSWMLTISEHVVFIFLLLFFEGLIGKRDECLLKFCLQKFPFFFFFFFSHYVGRSVVFWLGLKFLCSHIRGTWKKPRSLSFGYYKYVYIVYTKYTFSECIPDRCSWIMSLSRYVLKQIGLQLL